MADGHSVSKYAVSALLACAAGISVTVSMCLGQKLDARYSNTQLGSIYVSTTTLILAAILLTPPSLVASQRARCTKHPLPWLGGLCTIVAPVTIPANLALGTQLVLLVLLLGQLTTGLILDICKGIIRLFDYRRMCGFLIVLAGVTLDGVGSGLGADSDGSGSVAYKLIVLLATFLLGVGYTFQAKCNGMLGQELGSSTRAVVVCNLVNSAVMVPVCVILWATGNVAPAYDFKEDWLIWIGMGIQNAFYVGTLSVIPGILGYVTTNLALLAGKMASSSLVDALGLAGKVVPFTLIRAISLLLVFSGAILFSAKKRNEEICEPMANAIDIREVRIVSPRTKDAEQT